MSKVYRIAFSTAVLSLILTCTGCSNKITVEEVKTVLGEQKSAIISSSVDDFTRVAVDKVSVKTIDENTNGFVVVFERPSFSKLHSIAESDAEFVEVYNNCKDSSSKSAKLKEYYTALLNTEANVYETAEASVTVDASGSIDCEFYEQFANSINKLIEATDVKGIESTSGEENTVDVSAMTRITVGSSFVVSQEDAKFLVTIDSVIKGADAVEKVKALSPANQALVVDPSLTPVYLYCKVQGLNDESKVITNAFTCVSQDLVLKIPEGMQLYGLPNAVGLHDGTAEFYSFLVMDTEDLILWYGKGFPEVYCLML